MTWFSTTGGAVRAVIRATTASVMFALVVGSAPANAISCVGFVKKQIGGYAGATKLFAPSITGPDMYNAAKKASASYVGSMPSKGAIMIFAADNSKKGMGDGHAAMVSKLVSSKEIRIDHANFEVSGAESYDRKVTPIKDGNWSAAYIEKGKNGPLVGPYNVLGFISPALISVKK